MTSTTLNPAPIRRKRILEALVAGAAALLLALLAPAVSRADNYVINNGPSAPVPNTSVGPWAVFGGPQGNKTTWALTPGDYIGPLGASIAANMSVGVRVQAPAGSGITIREAKLWWYGAGSISGNGVSVFAATNVATLFSARFNAVVNRLTTPDDFVLSGNATLLQLWAFCSQSSQAPSCTMGSDSTPDLELAGSQLTLNDPGAPSGAVTGGGLDSTGTLSGPQSISYQATDSVSGVRMVQLLVDGQVVGKSDYLSSCPYDNFLACPASVTDSISWNSATAPDGTHDVELKLINPGNNAAVIDEHTITTSNAPVFTSQPAVSGTAASGQTLMAQGATTSSNPAAGSLTTGGQWLRCDAGGANCSPITGATGTTYLLDVADVGRTIRYRESAANNDGSSADDSDASGLVTDPNSSGGTTGGGTAGTTTGGTTDPGTGATPGGGGGQAGGTGAGASPVQTGTTTQTSPPSAGAPTGTPSRPVAGPLGTPADWRVSLSVARGAGHGRSRVTLAGAVATTPRPVSGKLVELQTRTERVARRNGRRVIVAGPWIIIGAVRTDAAGRFRAVLPLTHARDQTLQFRAVAPREGGYRNGQGTSGVVSIASS